MQKHGSVWHANLLKWHAKYGRHNLPWKNKVSPYRTWVSEVMLQQTQVSTVIPYFQCFVQKFPTVQILAEASIDAVLEIWAGLGYYRRAHNLHRSSKIVCEKHGGHLPDTLSNLLALPGIGKTTAGAILAFAFDKPSPILDTNIRRFYQRFFCTSLAHKRSETNLWRLCQQNLPHEKNAIFAQALMDLGTLICSKADPQCEICPLRCECDSWADKNFTLPPSKPIKKQTIKYSLLVLIHFSSKPYVLLQRRKNLGIWAGLLCFPQTWIEKEVRRRLRLATDPLQQGTGNMPLVRSLPSLHHSLTHRELILNPLLVIPCTQKDTSIKGGQQETKVRAWLSSLGLADKKDCQWHAFDDIQGGLPAPIKKILTSSELKEHVNCLETEKC